MLTGRKDENWVCPFCAHAQTVTSSNFHHDFNVISTTNSIHGRVALESFATACANPKCRQLSVVVNIRKVQHRGGGWEYVGDPLQSWNLWPESSAKPQPEFIPQVIKDDYYEACRILPLSPKASATLSRRCLQGMIRDFCGISKARLIDEIKELESRVQGGAAPIGVTPDSIEAIDAVREIGNIGAHMERDVNTIIDVDEEEAATLIKLIETLLDDWYLARHQRTQRFAGVKAIRDIKRAQKNNQGTE